MTKQSTDEEDSDHPESPEESGASSENSEDSNQDGGGGTLPPPTPSDVTADDSSDDPEDESESLSETTADLDEEPADDSASPTETTTQLDEDSDVDDTPSYEVPETQVLDSAPEESDDDNDELRDDGRLATPPPARSFIEDPENLAPDDHSPTNFEKAETVEEDENESEIELPPPDQVDSDSTTDIFSRDSDDNSSSEAEGPVETGSNVDDTNTMVSQAPETDVQPSAEPEPEPGNPESTQINPGYPQPDDVADNQPLSEAETKRNPRTAAPAPIDEEPATDESSWSPDWLSLPELERGRAMGIAAGIVVVTVAIALCFGAKFATSLDANRLSTAIAGAEKHRAADNYEAWLNAYRSTETDLTIASAPGPARSTIHSIGELLGSRSPAALRDRIAQRHAYYAAVIEYRFERSGSRRAAQLAEKAFSSSDSPLAKAASIYRKLARDRTEEAQTVADSANSEQLAQPPLAYAALEAALHADDRNRTADRAAFVEKRVDDDSRYRTFLLARAARYAKNASEAKRLRSFLKSSDSSHLGASIALVEKMRRSGKYEEAAKRARQLLKSHGDSASGYQRARLRLEQGESYAAIGQPSRALRAFRAAVEIEPGRTSVYLPLIDQLLEEGEFERAGDVIDRASTRAYPTRDLQLRRAHHALLVGQFERGLEALHPEAFPIDAPFVEGRLLLHLERYPEAEARFDEIDAPHPKSTSARALRILARIHQPDRDSSDAVRTVHSLVENSDGSPLLWRTAARLRLTVAERAGGEQQREHLQAATELAQRAAEAEPRTGLADYLLCEAYLARRNPEKARAACSRGRRKNPQFVPGLLTVARLELALHDSEDVELLLDGLSTGSPYDWRVDELRARAALLDGRPADAREIAAKWANGDAPVAGLQLLKGRIAFAVANYEKALRHFETVQTETDDDAEARLFYTHALVRLGRNAESAATELGKLNDHPTWNAEAWLVFGELRRRQNRIDDALENLRFAERNFDAFTSPDQRARLHTERILAWQQNFGWDHRRVQDNLKKVREFIREQEGVTTPELDLVLGLYNLEKKPADLDAAVEHLDKVVERQPHRCSAIRPLQTAFSKRAESGTTKPERASVVDSLAKKHCGG